MTDFHIWKARYGFPGQCPTCFSYDGMKPVRVEKEKYSYVKPRFFLTTNGDVYIPFTGLKTESRNTSSYPPFDILFKVSDTPDPAAAILTKHSLLRTMHLLSPTQPKPNNQFSLADLSIYTPSSQQQGHMTLSHTEFSNMDQLVAQPSSALKGIIRDRLSYIFSNPPLPTRVTDPLLDDPLYRLSGRKFVCRLNINSNVTILRAIILSGLYCHRSGFAIVLLQDRQNNLGITTWSKWSDENDIAVVIRGQETKHLFHLKNKEVLQVGILQSPKDLEKWRQHVI